MMRDLKERVGAIITAMSMPRRRNRPAVVVQIHRPEFTDGNGEVVFLPSIGEVAGVIMFTKDGHKDIPTGNSGAGCGVILRKNDVKELIQVLTQFLVQMEDEA